MEISAVFFILLETMFNFPVFFGILFAIPIVLILLVIFAPFRNWQHGKITALISALIAGTLAFFLLPVLFHSSLSNISYLTDWLFHIACVLVVIIYVYLVVWFMFIPSRVYPHRK